MYLVLTYTERFFPTFFCFFSYTFWSVNCMSWVSKLNSFFLKCMKTEAKLIFDGFNIVLYGKFISNSLIIFLLFFFWSVNCSREFSATLSVSKLYELSLWIIEHISEMFSKVSINLYLRFCSIAIYEKFYFYCFYHFRLFSGL